MTDIQFNNNTTRRVPVNRNNLFYSDEAFMYDIEMGKNYVEQDMNQTVILYQVDLTKTNADAVYGETSEDGVEYMMPVEVPCVYEIEEPELKSYDKSKSLGTYMRTGKLQIGVYQATLDELGCDIKKGDYIGIQVDEQRMIFFSVLQDGLNNYDNKHTMYGTRPFYRSITCSPVDKSEFQA